MSQPSVVIVGVGALGSHLAQFLRNEAKLTVIDFDRVESKNVLAQFHGRGANGRNKCISLQGGMRTMFGVDIQTRPTKLTLSNAETLLAKADLVVDCLDNAESRRTVQQTVRALGVPCVHGALAAEAALGRVVWDSHFVIDTDVPGAVTCEDGGQLPFIGVTASLLSLSCQKYLDSGKQIGYNITVVGGVQAL